MKLSIVIPIYKSEKNIISTYETIKEKILNNNSFHAELIFVNDGSPDNSLNLLKEICNQDNRVKIVNLTRNFGMHAAILAGMQYATGDCFSSISCDLQDPIDLIFDMIEKWKEGYKVVIANRKERKDPFLSKLFANLYYKLLRKMGLSQMPTGGFDFYLIDAYVKDQVLQMKEKNSDIMGQIVWLGFTPYIFEYTREKRTVGKSSWSFWKKIKLFIDSFVSFSYAPIRLISCFGVLISIIGGFFTIKILFDKFLNNITVDGYASIMVVLLLVSGVQLLTLGVIGEYLWRNYDESRKRPNFVVDEVYEIKQGDKYD